jgi:hypothetical protein
VKLQHTGVCAVDYSCQLCYLLHTVNKIFKEEMLLLISIPSLRYLSRRKLNLLTMRIEIDVNMQTLQDTDSSPVVALS